MLPKAERVRQSWVSGFLNLNLWLRDQLVIFIEAMEKVKQDTLTSARCNTAFTCI